MNKKIGLLTSIFNGIRFLHTFFESLESQTIFPLIEIALVHNEPKENESQLIDKFIQKYPGQVHYLTVPQVERIGASWNRGVAVLNSEYLAIWNIDDLRPPNSLEIQLRQLEKEKDCVCVYGDFIKVDKFGDREGELIRTPKFNPKQFPRSFPQGGGFLMWRKSIMEKIGYFDEQLHTCPDFDFTIRLVLSNYSMCQVEGIIGYYTYAGEGLSSRDEEKMTRAENSVLHKRYGNFDKVRWEHANFIRNYRIDEICSFNQWIPIRDLVDGFDELNRSRYILKIIGLIRNIFRFSLYKLGLLQYVHKIQKRFIKRDL